MLGNLGSSVRCNIPTEKNSDRAGQKITCATFPPKVTAIGAAFPPPKWHLPTRLPTGNVDTGPVATNFIPLTFGGCPPKPALVAREQSDGWPGSRLVEPGLGGCRTSEGDNSLPWRRVLLYECSMKPGEGRSTSSWRTR